MWNLIWKVKVPLKICNCIWRLLHDSLPTFLTLKNKGIANIGLCPLCDSAEESSTHTFLNCPSARACWYGSQLAIQTSEIESISVQQWVSRTILAHKWMEEDNMRYLQLLFTIIWTIWNHRNKVANEGLQPDPLNVILTSQSLFCRYQEGWWLSCSKSKSGWAMAPHH